MDKSKMGFFTQFPHFGVKNHTNIGVFPHFVPRIDCFTGMARKTDDWRENRPKSYHQVIHRAGEVIHKGLAGDGEKFPIYGGERDQIYQRWGRADFFHISTIPTVTTKSIYY